MTKAGDTAKERVDRDQWERTARLLDLLAGAERAIARLDADDQYGLCHLLHEAARAAGPVEAFYVCRYDPLTQSLHFLFNFDEGVYDHPSTFALGNGPTSRVVRTGLPYCFPDPTQTGRGTQNNGVPFGNLDTRSEAALHLPLWDRSGASPVVVGVLSAQSYQKDGFDALFLHFLTCLAERTGAVWSQWAARHIWEIQLRQARTAARELADVQVEGLKRIARQAEDAQKLVPPSLAPLRDLIANLRQTCYRLQTDQNILPLHPTKASPTAPPTPPTPSPETLRLERLSPREWEVAQLVAQGRTNKQISEQLKVTEHTVKTQIASILRKLEIEKRGQIARLLP